RGPRPGGASEDEYVGLLTVDGGGAGNTSAGDRGAAVASHLVVQLRRDRLGRRLDHGPAGISGRVREHGLAPVARREVDGAALVPARQAREPADGALTDGPARTVVHQFGDLP